MAITVKHSKVSTIPDDADTSLVRPSDWNADHTLVGLGTMAEQNANNVNITGGSITGVTGVGDVVGPASATDNAIARFDTTTGKLIQNSGVTIDDNSNITANALDDGYLNTAASGTLITLTSASVRRYTITGSGGQTIKLPNATTLANGTVFQFDNNQSSGAITVNNNSNTLVVSVPSGGFVLVNLLSNATAAGSWDRHDQAPANVSWSTNTFDYAGSITSATWNGNTVAVNRGGTGQSTYTDGQLLIGNSTGNTLTKSTLTAGTGISVTNGSGAITVINSAPDQTVAIASGTGISVTGTYPSFTVTNTSPSSGGTVTSVTGTAPVSVATGTTTPVISMAAANTTTNGYLTSTDWTTFNNKGSGSVTSVAGTGTVSGIALSGTVTSSGNLTLGGTLDLSSPPTIGNTAPNTGKFTTLESTGTASLGTTSAQYIQAVGDALYPQVKAVGSGTDIPLVLQPKGTGALQAQLTDSTATGGNARGANAVDFQTLRSANTMVASGNYSSVLAGRNSTASGTDSHAIGLGCNSSGTGAISISYNGISNASVSVVLGGSRGTSRSIQGNTVFPASNSPIADVSGNSQAALLILGRQTTDATATVLASNSSAAAATNQIALPQNSAYYFTGEVIAGVTAAGNTKGWSISGVIKRGVLASTTALVGTPTVTSLYADTGASTWSVAVTANTTLGCLTITVTGQASNTIRWVAQIRTTEMTF
jgi:hypothetical protein